MGDFYVNTSGTAEGWRKGTPYVRTSSGWKIGNYVYRYNGSSWVEAWQRDNTPPSVSLSVVREGRRGIVMTVSASGGPLNRVVVKIKKGSAPSNPDSTSSSTGYVSTSVGGRPWSEWIVEGSGASSLGSTTRGYESTGLPETQYSTTYYVTAWAQDNFFNWSTPVTRSVTTLSAPPPEPVLKTYYATFDPSSSRSYSRSRSIWPSDSGTYVYQAGSDNWEGCWFHGTAIRTALSGANAVTDVSLRIQRVNTAHGDGADAFPQVRVHHHTSRPSGRPTLEGNQTPGGLRRGEAETFALSSSAFDFSQFITGQNRSFGLGWGETPHSSTRYMYAYGAGTTSGRIYIRWNKYV